MQKRDVNMRHIFVSHAEKDNALMQQIARGLEAAGYPTWYFERDVHAGTSYLIQIAHAVEDCEAFVLIASPHAIVSDQVTKEVVGAFEQRKQFFPVLVDLTPPELKERQYEWRHALGGTTMITLGAQGIPAVIDQIIAGLMARGIQPIAGAATPSPSGGAAAPDAERKQVTVMFADIAGFTAMSERMDPEEVTDVMKDCFSMMGACIDEYGGTIDKFMGDCVMVLFGAPQAQEDAPQRALNTALKIRTRLKDFNAEKCLTTPLDIHIGINTGPVIAGLMGSDKRQDFTVMGDTVNLASRLEGVAEKGAILISENTYRLAEGYFDFAYAGEVQVKGKELPVKTWSVLGPRRIITRIEAGYAKGLSPFVGRGKEIDHLRDRFAQARDGHGQVVGVVGEPGVGKSRLIRQFRESLAQSEFTCIEGGCINFGDAIPYLPVLDMLKDYFAIKDEDSEAAIKENIAAGVAGLGNQLMHILAPLSEILSLKVEDEEYIKLDPKQRREKVFEAIRLLLVAQSQIKPLVVIIEDLHWIDKTSEEFLTTLINSLAATRILLLLLYRPEYIPTWTAKTYFSQTRLDQLSRQTIADLVRSILENGDVDAELIEFIANRTEGNPLFIEELTRDLLESGAIQEDGNRYALALQPGDIQVPANIQGIIAARLDRLEGTLKGVMQTSSVIGREFAFRILQAVAALKDDLKPSLDTLQDLELIYEKNLFPELEYIFKHALTQEVAYNSLLIKKRKEIHARVGQAIEQIYKDRLEEFYEMLAYHYSLSENAMKAYQYLRLSMNKATKNYANWEAIRFYKESIRVLNIQPESDEINREKLDISLSIYNVLFILGFPEGTLDILNEAETRAKILDDGSSLITVYSRIGHYHSLKGNPGLGITYSEMSFEQAVKMKDIAFMAQTARYLCLSHFVRGDNRKMFEISYRTLRMIEESKREKDIYFGINVYSVLCGWCGHALGIMGKSHEYASYMEKGIMIAQQCNDKYAMGYIEQMHAVTLFWEGADGDTIIDHAQKCIRYWGEGGVDIFMGLGWCILGIGYSLLGEYETAATHLLKGYHLQEKVAQPFFTAYVCFHLAINYFFNKDLRSAKEYFEKALQYSLESEALGYETISRILLWRTKIKEDPIKIGEARSDILQGIALLEERSLHLLSAFGYMNLGELFFDIDYQQEALENLKKAESMYLKMQIPPQSYWLARIREDLAKLVRI